MCSKTCGTGSRTRKRQCTYPDPQHIGSDCAGNGSESRDCNTDHCPGYT